MTCKEDGVKENEQNRNDPHAAKKAMENLHAGVTLDDELIEELHTTVRMIRNRCMKRNGTFSLSFGSGQNHRSSIQRCV